MPIIVQKYGGTSVANPDRIANVANRVVKGWRDGNKMVVVLSAMAGETDRLIKLATGTGGGPGPPGTGRALSHRRAGDRVSVFYVSQVPGRAGHLAA